MLGHIGAQLAAQGELTTGALIACSICRAEFSAGDGSA